MGWMGKKGTLEQPRKAVNAAGREDVDKAVLLRGLTYPMSHDKNMGAVDSRWELDWGKWPVVNVWEAINFVPTWASLRLSPEPPA